MMSDWGPKVLRFNSYQGEKNLSVGALGKPPQTNLPNTDPQL